MVQQGQVFKLKTRGGDGKPTWAYRYRVDGRGSARPQVGGFATHGEALRALRAALERLHRRNARLAQITLSELTEEYLAQHEAEPRTIAKLRWLLAKATCAFGDCRVVDLQSDEIAAWRTALPAGHRFEATQALRQVLNRAVAWKIIDSNPAKAGVDNPRRQHPEKRPFESWAEIDAVTEQLGAAYGPMIVFAAATGLRPSEWIALERRDLDRDARIVYVRRAFAHGRLKNPKTRRSMRAVPLQSIALDVLDRLPARRETALVFPAPRGGYLDLHNFSRRAWRAAQLAAGIEPVRRPYDLRHTFATFALRAGISTFDLSRFMGASLTMIDRHYGHLARDGREHAAVLRRDQRGRYMHAQVGVARTLQMFADITRRAKNRLDIIVTAPVIQDPRDWHVNEIAALERGVSVRVIYSQELLDNPERYEPLVAYGADVRASDDLPLKMVVRDDGSEAVVALVDSSDGEHVATSVSIRHPELTGPFQLLFNRQWRQAVDFRKA